MDRAQFSDPESAGNNGHAYSAIVHQASGMVSIQSECSPEDALALMVAYATANARSLDAVARDVIELHLRFDVAGNGHTIEPA